jgi:hypothetical protein
MHTDAGDHIYYPGWDKEKLEDTVDQLAKAVNKLRNDSSSSTHTGTNSQKKCVPSERASGSDDDSVLLLPPPSQVPPFLLPTLSLSLPPSLPFCLPLSCAHTQVQRERDTHTTAATQSGIWGGGTQGSDRSSRREGHMLTYADVC